MECEKLPLRISEHAAQGLTRARSGRPAPVRIAPATARYNGATVVSHSFPALSFPALVVCLAAWWAVVPTSTVRADDLNDYPTSVRADYVFGCMKANGESRQALDRCSCSIDVIASILPYDRYVSAETVLSMSQVPGVLGSQFRATESARVAVDDLRRAQAEAQVRCF
jgi:hypothetical protein